MVVFPNAKINLGLNITARRRDGYHDLDMVMMPIGWCDILEIVPAKGEHTTLSVSGRAVDCPMEKNLVYRAWKKLNEAIDGDLPEVDIYLHKNIPDGAGLGGGSSDAAFTLLTLNKLFSIGFSERQLAEIAGELGADCPFFIYNRPMHCTGTGTDMAPININFGSATNIVIAKPIGVSVSTAEAYRGVRPAIPEISTDMIVSAYAPDNWSEHLANGFEPHIFEAKPEIAKVKQTLTDCGAIYASMSGSGSAVYGIFDNVKMAEDAVGRLPQCDCFIDTISDTLRF